jgi:hypothetical protein
MVVSKALAAIFFRYQAIFISSYQMGGSPLDFRTMLIPSMATS